MEKKKATKSGKTLSDCNVTCLLQHEVFLEQREGEREVHCQCSDCQGSDRESCQLLFLP